MSNTEEEQLNEPTTNDLDSSDVSTNTTTQMSFNAEFLELSSIPVVIDEPRKVGGTLDKTFIFRISGTSELLAPASDFKATRSWQDFVWLERTLVAKYSYLFIPQIMKKTRPFNFNDPLDGNKRALELQRLINRMTSHPELVKSKILQNFISMDVDNFRLYKKEVDDHLTEVQSTDYFRHKALHPPREPDQFMEGMAQKRNEWDNWLHSVNSLQAGTLQHVLRGQGYVGDAETFAGCLSELMVGNPNCEDQETFSTFAKCQQNDSSFFLQLFNSDRYNTYELTKHWQNLIFSEKEFLNRYEVAKERHEHFTQNYEQKKHSRNNEEKQKAERLMLFASDMYDKHKYYFPIELDQIEYYNMKDRLHWSKCFAMLRIEIFKQCMNSWKGYLDTLENFQEEHKRKRAEMAIVKNLSKTSPFRLSVTETMQKQKATHPDLDIPYVLRHLIDTLIKYGGLKTMGIFRKSVEAKTLQSIKLELEKGNYDVKIEDPVMASCLIKAWLKDIRLPIIPKSGYHECIKHCAGDSNTLRKILDQFPKEHVAVIHHLVILCRKIAEKAEDNKMNIENLAIIMSPNICRCPDSGIDMLANTKREIQFVGSLLERLKIDSNTSNIVTADAKYCEPLVNLIRTTRVSVVTPMLQRQSVIQRVVPPPPGKAAPVRPSQSGVKPNLSNSSSTTTTTTATTTTTSTTATTATSNVSPAVTSVPATGTVKQNSTSAAPQPALNSSSPSSSASATGSSSSSISTSKDAMTKSGGPTDNTDASWKPKSTTGAKNQPRGGSALPAFIGNRTKRISKKIINDEYIELEEDEGEEPECLMQVVAMANFTPESFSEVPLIEGAVYKVYAVDPTQSWYEVDGPNGELGWVPAEWCQKVD